MNWIKALLHSLDFILHAIVYGDKVPYTKPMTEISPDVVMAPIIIPPKAVPIKTSRELLYDLAASCIGKDIAKTQNELGCAEAISYLLISLKCPNFPAGGFLSTTDLYYWMKKNFVLVWDSNKDDGESKMLPGDIIISPTGFSKNPSAHGHVGINAKHGILSNNSMTGLFDEYYTTDKWEYYYMTKLGFPVFVFRWE